MSDPSQPIAETKANNSSSKRSRPVIWLGAIVVLVVLVCCGLGPLFVQVPFHLLLGWIFFSVRTLPNVSINPMQCLFAVLLVFGVFGSLYWFGRSLTQDRAIVWNAKHTGFAVELVVASFVVGLGATGVAHQIGWLVRSPDPLIGGTGLAARRMSDSNNYKQVLLAVHNYASAYDKVIDPTIYRGDGDLLHGWQTALLPFVDQQRLYEQIDRDRAWNDPVNAAAVKVRVPTYETPFDGLPTTSGARALTHQTGNARIFADPSIRRFQDVSDGLANTIYGGGAAGNYAAWAHPANWRDPSSGMNQSPDGFGGPFQGGCHIAMADGAVVFMTDSIDPQLLQALSTPAGNEVVEELLNQ